MCSILAVFGFLTFIEAVFGVYFTFIDSFFKRMKFWYVLLVLGFVVAGGWAVTLARALAERKAN